MEDGEDATESCVTSQGIQLRVVNPAKKQTIMEATALSVAPQDPTHFVVPPGYQRMQLPGSGGTPGAPRGR